MFRYYMTETQSLVIPEVYAPLQSLLTMIQNGASLKVLIAILVIGLATPAAVAISNSDDIADISTGCTQSSNQCTLSPQGQPLDLSCQIDDADGSFTSCFAEQENDDNLKSVVLTYCSTDCDSDLWTDGRVNHETWDSSGNPATDWWNAYEEGTDQDPDNDDNTVGCGSWHHFQDAASEVAGSIESIESTGCDFGGPDGWFQVGVNFE